MSHAISGITNVVHDIGHAISNPAQLIGTGLGFGIGGAGGLLGGTVAGNVATGQPVGQGLQNAAMGDIAGLGAGVGLSGLLGMFDSAAPEALGYAGGAGVDATPAGTEGLVQLSGPGADAAAGGGGVSAGDALSGAGAASRLLGGTPGAGGGNPFMNFLTGSGGGPSLLGLAPGLAALQYARNQPGLDTSKLGATYDQAAANAPLFTQAAIDPLKQSQAAGYGDLLQSQANRGIRGSSFGDQDISNFLTTTNRGISDAGASAAQQALGLQGNLAGNLALLQNQAQQQKNQLYGRAFDMLGRGLQPNGMPSANPGMGGMGTNPLGGLANVGGGASSFMNNLNLGGVGNAFGNALTGIGSGIGSIFGSPGSTFWGSAPIQGMPTDYLGSLAGF